MSRDSVAGRQAVIGRSTRIGRGGRRPTFVLVAVFKAGMAGRDHLDRFVDEAGQYAATVRGGLSTGASAVAVAVVEAPAAGSPAAGTGGAGDWAQAPRTGRSPVFPVLVEPAAGRVTCPDEPADLRRLVGAHVEVCLRSS